MEQSIEILKALADVTRIKIITLLLSHDFCVGALAKRVGLTEAAISQHLQILRNAGLVNGEKRGYFTHYSVDRKVLKKTADKINKTASIVPKCIGSCYKNNNSEKQSCCRNDNDKLL